MQSLYIINLKVKHIRAIKMRVSATLKYLCSFYYEKKTIVYIIYLLSEL